MTTTTTDVLVIGAGPAGLTLANLLIYSKVQIRILDKKVGPSDQTRALVVHAKTLELLNKLGLADQAVEEGRKLGAVELFGMGRPTGMISFLDDGAGDRTPYPFALSYAQSQTEQLLLHHINEAGGRIEWNTELLELVQMPDHVRATVRRSDGEEETIEARWIIGADGAHSQVRHALSLGFAGSTYEQTLFLADVDLQSPLKSREVYFDLTRLGFNGFFSMPGDAQRFRLLGSLSPELADREELTLDEVQHLLNDTSSLHVDILKARWISVYHIHHRMAERFRVGRVFLVGDAAHIHSPAGGQGMNTGIGDAYNLGWKLALVIKGQAPETLLDSYEDERMPFARAILRGSDRSFLLAVTTNPLGRRLKLFAVPLLFRLLSRQLALRRWAFWYLSQLWTSYRNSPAIVASEVVKKGPQAGDRAPYGFFEDGPDAGKSIFALLKGLDHHLLFFSGSRMNSQHTTVYEAEESLQTLLDMYKAPIHLHTVSEGNRSLWQRYGANVPSLFLVRPDGHIAYRGRAEDLDSLRACLDALFCRQDIQTAPNIS